MKKNLALLFALVTLLFQACTSDKQSIDLSGTWSFVLDREGSVKPTNEMPETVTLPGTTDTNRKGDPIGWKGETTHLSRPFSYKGRAWYRRTVEIPEAWAGKPVILTLERTKPTEVYVDGALVGKGTLISTPQRFDLSASLTPGTHELAIMVDNGSGVPEQVYQSSHAYTESTQTNWNGIIGDITLTTSLPEKKEIAVHPAFKDPHRGTTVLCQRASHLPARTTRCLCVATDWPCGDGRGFMAPLFCRVPGVWTQPRTLPFMVSARSGLHRGR